MRAYHAMGQRGCAIRQYLACAEALRRELGEVPAAATRRLYEVIRSDGAVPDEEPLRA
jgi:DNA-binding SARP family transcriptional activator